jgi:hypothetical protein
MNMGTGQKLVHHLFYPLSLLKLNFQFIGSVTGLFV